VREGEAGGVLGLGQNGDQVYLRRPVRQQQAHRQGHLFSRPDPEQDQRHLERGRPGRNLLVTAVIAATATSSSMWVISFHHSEWYEFINVSSISTICKLRYASIRRYFIIEERGGMWYRFPSYFLVWVARWCDMVYGVGWVLARFVLSDIFY